LKILKIENLKTNTLSTDISNFTSSTESSSSILIQFQNSTPTPSPTFKPTFSVELLDGRAENDVFWYSDKYQDGEVDYPQEANTELQKSISQYENTADEVYSDIDLYDGDEFKKSQDFSQQSEIRKDTVSKPKSGNFLSAALGELESLENKDDFVQTDGLLSWEDENSLDNQHDVFSHHHNDSEFLSTQMQDIQRRWITANFTHLTAFHLDFKAGLIPIDFLEKVLPATRKYGANAVLLEYESIFPYQGDLREDSTASSVSKEQILKILNLIEKSSLQAIPYVNLCNDLGFLLNRSDRNHGIRTGDVDTVNPAADQSVDFVVEVVRQMLALHEKTTWFHIGCRMPTHIGWSMAEKQWMHNNQGGIGDLFAYYLHRITSRIVSSHPELKLLIWGNDLLTINPYTLTKDGLNKRVYPIFESYSKGKHIALDFEAVLDTASLFPASFGASAFKGYLKVGTAENLPSVKHYTAGINHWVEAWTSFQQRGLPMLGTFLMGPNRHDHWSELTEPFPISIVTLASCIYSLVNKGWYDSVRYQVEEALGIEILPEKMYPRPMPIINGEFPGADVWKQLQAIENRNVEIKRLLNDHKLFEYVTPYHLKKCKLFKPYLGEIRMRVKSQLHRTEDDIGELKRAMMQVMPPRTVTEWLRQYTSSTVETLKNVMNRIDLIWNCEHT